VERGPADRDDSPVSYRGPLSGPYLKSQFPLFAADSHDAQTFVQNSFSWLNFCPRG